MKNFRLALIVIISYVLQTVIVPDFNICGVAPNLMLVITCCIAFLLGSTVGGTVGFFSGLLLDFNQGRTIGLSAFLCMYIGIIIGKSNKRFFKDNHFIAVIFTVISVLIYESIMYFFSILVYSQSFELKSFASNILFSAVCNLIIGLVAYPSIIKINESSNTNRRIFSK